MECLLPGRGLVEGFEAASPLPPALGPLRQELPLPPGQGLPEQVGKVLSESERGLCLLLGAGTCQAPSEGRGEQGEGVSFSRAGSGRRGRAVGAFPGGGGWGVGRGCLALVSSPEFRSAGRG